MATKLPTDANPTIELEQARRLLSEVQAEIAAAQSTIALSEGEAVEKLPLGQLDKIFVDRGIALGKLPVLQSRETALLSRISRLEEQIAVEERARSLQTMRSRVAKIESTLPEWADRINAKSRELAVLLAQFKSHVAEANRDAISLSADGYRQEGYSESSIANLPLRRLVVIDEGSHLRAAYRLPVLLRSTEGYFGDWSLAKVAIADLLSPEGDGNGQTE